MDLKLSTLLGLGLTLAPTLITTDLHFAQVQAECNQIPCVKGYIGTKYGPSRLPPEIIIKEGDRYEAEGNYDLAKAKYSEALDLAIKYQDSKSEAIARGGLDKLKLNAPSLQNNNSLQLQNQPQR